MFDGLTGALRAGPPAGYASYGSGLFPTMADLDGDGIVELTNGARLWEYVADAWSEDPVFFASGDKAPSDIPGVTNRFLIAVIDSTWSSGTGPSFGWKSSRSRRCTGGRACIALEYCFQTSYDPRSQADCRICIDRASQAWLSPERRDL